jgi:hypothetical protein
MNNQNGTLVMHTGYTRRKWKVVDSVYYKESRLMCRNDVGLSQHDKAGLWQSPPTIIPAYPGKQKE